MDIDPHTIQQLLEKIRSHLRCPQCTRKVTMPFESLKVMGQQFAVFQLACEACTAHIFLHATLRLGTAVVTAVPRSLRPLDVARNSGQAGQTGQAPSTALSVTLDPQELEALRQALRDAGGSFSMLFEEENT